ncbi:hypothetical protein CkaCkLH20_07153 [Colletotrichum karsti]|uniref:Uncharacterized protein n=1 Tax=Colletotrichum karsti TaxID=1095194 RepID=A0A9P6I115_9PEZI|nr:uncharacterized protein CkaCkLH20_07153 [Colletotrichum karsti]KAF9875333.1 hypothetical protein CkaCkLH20_07153 [Colletotrichum karsti]
MKLVSALQFALSAALWAMGKSMPQGGPIDVEAIATDSKPATLEDGHGPAMGLADVDVVDVEDVEAAGASFLSADGVSARGPSCFFEAFAGSQCDGQRLYYYEYAYARGECRSCRKWEGAHSFRVSGTCDGGYMVTKEGDSCGGFRSGTVHFGSKEPSCVSVNTGIGWDHGYPCFYK